MKIALIQQSAGCDREENIECAIEAMRTAADAGAAKNNIPVIAKSNEKQSFVPRRLINSTSFR